MPISRLISDLDHLIVELSVDGPATSPILDELRLSVARVNELRRQLDIAQLKLASVLSLAGIKVMERQLESGETSPKLYDRFKVPDDLSTGITEVDQTHRAIFQAGNFLYWQALQREVNAQDVDGALTKLIHCTNAAFEIEEKMMATSGYARLKYHREIHQRMRNYLSEMQELVSTQPLAVVVKLERFLGSWFLWHIQREDVDFSQHFVRKQSDIQVHVAIPPMSIDKVKPTISVSEQVQREVVDSIKYPVHKQSDLPPPVVIPPVSITNEKPTISVSEQVQREVVDSIKYPVRKQSDLPPPAVIPPISITNEKPTISEREQAQREVIDISKQFVRKQGELQAPFAIQPISIAIEEQSEPAPRNPARELGYLLRGAFSSWLISWRERRHVARTSRTILALHRTICASHPVLPHNEIYKFVVMVHTGCDTATAKSILNRAHESFAEWPVSRALKLRDVVHYLTVTEYLDRYGQDFWMRSEINKMVAAQIPGNL